MLLVLLTNDKGLGPADEQVYRTLVDRLHRDIQDVVMLQDFVDKPGDLSGCASRPRTAVDLVLDAGGHDLRCCLAVVMRCPVFVVIAISTEPVRLPIRTDVLAPDSGNDRTSATSLSAEPNSSAVQENLCERCTAVDRRRNTPSINRRQTHPKWSWPSSHPRPTDYHRTDASSSQRCVSSFVRQWF